MLSAQRLPTHPLKPRLLRQTERLWGLIRQRYTGANGLVNHFVDPFSGTVVRTRNTIQDYGDYVQYAAWAGRKLGRPDLVQWAIDQVLIGSALFQTTHGFFLTNGTTQRKTRPRWYAEYFRLEDNSDLLMGLVSTYRITRDARILAIADRLVQFIDRQTPRQGVAGNIFFVTPAWALPLPFRMPDGLFVEELVHLYELTGRPSYLELARALSGQWERTDYYRRHGAYPIAAYAPGETSRSYRVFVRSAFHLGRWAGVQRRLRSSYFIKSNTNMLSGDLALIRAAKDRAARARVMRALAFVQQRLLREDGFFYGRWDEVSQQPQVGAYPVADNHHLLNIFLDASFYFKDAALLDIAERNAAFWLRQRTPLGFFPELYKPGFERAAVLDMQVDYLVTLLKLAQLTGKATYRDAVLTSTEALLTHFDAPYGLKWCIDADTGMNMKPAICSKFLSLFTKLLLVLDDVLEGKDLYTDHDLFDLTRDR